MSSHQWYYRKESALGTVETVGPIDEMQLQGLALDGSLRLETLLASPSRTAGKWVAAKLIPALVKLIGEGEDRRREQREREEAERKRLANERALVVQQQQAAAEAAWFQEKQELAKISHSQNFELIKDLRDRVSTLLTSSESVAYIAVQEKPLINVSPDAIVATNRRIIFYRAKLLGRYEFQDFMWLDVRNAHIQKKILGAIFSCQHVSGQWLMMDYLPRASAETLYRLAQEGEERARIARREMDLEMRRAGAANISTNVNVAAPAYAPPAVDAKTTNDNDPVKKLESLKAMLDKGLISQADFDKAKVSILSQL